MLRRAALSSLALVALLGACGGPIPEPDSGLPRVLAVESFLADIAQNVAGDRLDVDVLLPLGTDPHSYQASPRDVVRIASSDVLILNGAHFEEFLEPILENAPAGQVIITASTGLTPRQDPDGDHPGGDPHFWLDPILVVSYVENIRAGLTEADPAGEPVYRANAETYIAALQALDLWIQEMVATVPVERRLLVTNHESLGYFAGRYGFTIVGAVIPSFSSGASPTAQELAGLIEQIRSSGATAIFLETGANPDLARQVAAETGLTVVTDIHTHSLSPPGGPAPSYLEMMRYNVSLIVTTLQP